MTRRPTHGDAFRIGVWTGASTAPELDGALAKVGGIEMRLPYQSDPTCRARINAGELEYLDIHLSHVAQFVWFGFLGKLNVAVVEVAAILEDGRLVPASSIGNNKTWLDLADKVILEVNSAHARELEGMHDIYYGTALPPHRKPIPLLHPDDRIGDACPLRFASATALSLSESGMREVLQNLDFYRSRILLRPQEMSNHPEVIRRLGIIAMNGMIEADIYGNVNSTHVMGTRIMNGIGGSRSRAWCRWPATWTTPGTTCR